MKEYNGDVRITEENSKEWMEKLKDVTLISGDLYVHSNAKMDALKSVDGYLTIDSNAKLDALKSVGGDLSIYSKVEDSLLRRLWKHNRTRIWHLTNLVPDWLLNKKGKFRFYINNVEFEKEMFDKARKGRFSAKEVLAIKNVEQRRVAYGLMNKAKMKKLKGFAVLDKATDSYGNAMEVVSFKVDGFEQPFKYLHCACPSTKREYFVETKQDTCEKAKAKSFGFDKIKFDEEY